MVLSLSGCEKLGAPRCGASQVARDDRGAMDKATQRVALQPAQASSSALSDALHRNAASSSPDLDCKAMKSFGNFSDRLLEPSQIGFDRR